MGFFNYLICEYPLPLPEEAKEIDSLPDWSEFEFQTKSLSLEDENMFELGVYHLDEEGEIYRQIIDNKYVEDEEGLVQVKEIDKGIERVDFTGELIFNGLHLTEEYDYFMEFKALFWKGELKELNLSEWSKEDNVARKEAQKELKDKFERLTEERSAPVKFWNKAVRVSVFIIQYLLSCLMKFVHKVQKWISI